jgi:hypothetical protein
MASQAASSKRQQGKHSRRAHRVGYVADSMPDLQVQYSNYKNTLQQIAQKIGDVEQEAEEHK